MGKLTSYSRTLIQQHLADGSDNESVTNGDHSSPYMSNAATSSPTTASIAPTGDGVSVRHSKYQFKIDLFRRQLIRENFHHVNNVIVKLLVNIFIY